MSTNPSTATKTGGSSNYPNMGQQDKRMPESVDRALDQGVQFVRECVRENPEAAALWCLGIGFVLGWKLKPW